MGVGVIDPGSVDGDQDLPLTGRRLLDIADLEDLGSTELGDLYGSHAAESLRVVQLLYGVLYTVR